MMKNLLLFSFFLTLIVAKGQQDSIVYYRADGEILTDSSLASGYIKISKVEKEFITQYYNREQNKWKKIYTEKVKIKNNLKTKVTIYKTKWDTKSYRRDYKMLADSTYSFKEYKNEKVVEDGLTKTIYPLTKTGNCTTYYYNGKIKSIKQYHNNKMTSNQNWTKSGESKISNVFGQTDIPPKFNSTAKNFGTYLIDNFKFPERYNSEKFRGFIYIEFVVMENGSLDGITVLEESRTKDVSELVDFIKNSPDWWTPGYIGEKAVRVKLILPINLNNGNYHY